MVGPSRNLGIDTPRVCLFQIKRMLDKKIYIIQGEIGTVVGAIKRNSRWNTHTPLVSLKSAIFTH